MMGIRSATMASLSIGDLGSFGLRGPRRRLATLGDLLRYAMRHTSRKRRILVDVNSLVDKWIAAIVGMCLAHDKAEYVNPDDESDEVVVPMSWENGPLIHATQRAFPDKPIRVENANDHGIRFEPAE